MVSSYLERPLRSLDQALEDRGQARVPSTRSARAPSALLVQAADSPASGPGSVELLVRLLSDGADRSPPGRRRAA